MNRVGNRLRWGLVAAGALIWTMATPVAAQMLPGLGGDQPLDIDAQQGIEWYQDRKLYVARGDARAVRGNTTVYADVLVAYYREVPDGGTEIYQMVADGQVHIISPDQEVFADRAVYNVDRKVALLTGDTLRLVTPTDVVTARDSLEYYEDQNLAVARGDAIAVREDSRLRADVLVGQFVEDTTGSLVLDRIDGTGEVVITTPTDIARSERLMYSTSANIAVLTGQVRITRGENQINGDVAEMNLTTKVNRVLSSGRRVRGLFVPGTETAASPADDGEAAPAETDAPAG